MPTLSQTPSDHPVNQLPPVLNRALDELIQSNLGYVFPALAVTIVHRGEVLLNAAWGWIDPETQTLPTRTDSLFDLASVSKMFNVTAFLTLVNQGKVTLDTRLADIVPEFGRSGLRSTDGGQDPHSKAMLAVADEMRGKMIDPTSVTLRHLATHTSGLAPWRAVYNAAGPAPAAPDQPEIVARSIRWARGLEMICTSPFVGEPGDRVRYSDLGMMLLGEVVTRLHAPTRDLDAAVQERVLTPLNLPSITYNPVRNGRPQTNTIPTEMDAEWRKRRPWGEVHDENACGLGGIAGHAGLFGTARDVAAFGQAWLEGNLPIAPALLQEATTEQGRSDDARHGLGWVLPTQPSPFAALSPRSYGHTGFTGTSLWIDPERALAAACLSNRVYYGRERQGIEEFRRAFHNMLADGIESSTL
jgi:CubicO group peptidase (beta-lactamase class C family)